MEIRVAHLETCLLSIFMKSNYGLNAGLQPENWHSREHSPRLRAPEKEERMPRGILGPERESGCAWELNSEMGIEIETQALARVRDDYWANHNKLPLPSEITLWLDLTEVIFGEAQNQHSDRETSEFSFEVPRS